MSEIIQRFLVEVLKFCPRQMVGLEQIGVRIAQIFDADSLRRALAGIVAVFQLFFSVILDTNYKPSGQKIDLSGYELVFEDEFEGTELNTTAWKYCNTGVTRGGYRTPSQVEIKDGNCVITAEYLEDGQFGAGWYAGDLALLKWYKHGYFEIRCKVSDGGGFWSAFWLMGRKPYDAEYSKGGIGSAEIDIMEAPFWKQNDWHNCIHQNIHCAGVEGIYDGLYVQRENVDTITTKFESLEVGRFLGNDIYNEYNTYGLEWTEDEYIFYVNGVETARTSFGNGTSTETEEVRVTLCVPDAEALSKLDKDTYHSEYVIDYVRIYQK